MGVTKLQTKEVARNVLSFLHLGLAMGRAALSGRLGFRLWLWFPQGSFLTQGAKWKTEPDPGFEKVFFIFYPLSSSALSLPFWGLVFSVSVSLGFPLSTYH